MSEPVGLIQRLSGYLAKEEGKKAELVYKLNLTFAKTAKYLASQQNRWRNLNLFFNKSPYMFVKLV